MKKVLVHLSMLCLLAFLLMPLVGCKHDETPEVEEQPATSTEAPAAMGTETTSTSTTTTTTTTMGTESTMGTEGGAMGGMTGGAMGTMGTEPPPAH